MMNTSTKTDTEEGETVEKRQEMKEVQERI